MFVAIGAVVAVLVVVAIGALVYKQRGARGQEQPPPEPVPVVNQVFGFPVARGPVVDDDNYVLPDPSQATPALQARPGPTGVAPALDDEQYVARHAASGRNPSTAAEPPVYETLFQ